MRLLHCFRPRNTDFVRPVGWRLFWFLLQENIWRMLGLSLLTAVASLPLISIPAALCSCSDCCLRLIEDRPVNMLCDFWTALRRNLRQTLGYSLFCLPILGLLAFAADVYLADGLHWQAAACTVGAGFIWMLGFYAFPMICRAQLSLRAIISNAFRLLCARIFVCFALLLLQLTLVIAGFFLLPIGLLIPLLLGIPFGLFPVVFVCYGDIRKYILIISQKTDYP